MVTANINNQAKDRLPQEDDPSLADMSADSSRVNMDALIFMANIPPKYWGMMAGSAAVQWNAQLQENKENRNRSSSLERAFRDAAYQRQIDAHRLKFDIDGVEVDISQGDLRKSMEARVDVLNERIKTLQRSGENPEELHRMRNLVKAYEPVIEKARVGGDDEGTINAAKNLMKQDPEWAAEIKSLSGNNVQAAASLNDRRTSYAGAYLDEGAIAGPSLKDSFTKNASPDTQQQPPAIAAPDMATQQQGVKQTLQGLGL